MILELYEVGQVGGENVHPAGSVLTLSMVLAAVLCWACYFFASIMAAANSNLDLSGEEGW